MSLVLSLVLLLLLSLSLKSITCFIFSNLHNIVDPKKHENGHNTKGTSVCVVLKNNHSEKHFYIKLNNDLLFTKNQPVVTNSLLMLQIIN